MARMSISNTSSVLNSVIIARDIVETMPQCDSPEQRIANSESQRRHDYPGVYPLTVIPDNSQGVVPREVTR